MSGEEGEEDEREGEEGRDDEDDEDGSSLENSSPLVEDERRGEETVEKNEKCHNFQLQLILRYLFAIKKAQ